MSEAAAARLVGVTQQYGLNVVLKDLSLDVPVGVTSLLGPNGAGKSMLIRTIATVSSPVSGSVVVDGNKVVDRASRDEARTKIGYLPQAFGFDPGMSVEDFIHYGTWIRGVPKHERQHEVELALRSVNMWDTRKNRMRKLSGGMLRRTGIAWAFAGRPVLVVLDEPTVGLDPQQRRYFRQVINELSSSTAILVSTHLTDDVAAFNARTVVLNEGHILFQGTTAAFRATSPSPESTTAIEDAYVSLIEARSTS